MKTTFFGALLLSMFLSLNHSIAAPAGATTRLNDPEVKVVVSQKRIWLVTDEISVKSLTLHVMNEQGKVVMEKIFSSKTTDWSLVITSLPSGKYSVMIGAKKMTEFERQ
jgi:hypothetical protein